jgi:thioesterase domain-containing protein
MKSIMKPPNLESIFHHEIPITQGLDLKVLSIEASQIEMSFGLKANRNHKGTAFGGSQYNACVLACYGLFLVGIREMGYATNNIVVSEGLIKYRRPVEHDFVVIAKWDEAPRNDFFAGLKRKGKAKVSLQAQVYSQGASCTEFTGQFVALL